MSKLSLYAIGIVIGIGTVYLAKKYFIKNNSLLNKRVDYKIYSFLKNKGLSKANASGIVGNLYAESKFNPMAIGDNGNSFGVAQWHKDRWNNLKVFAFTTNQDFTKLNTQLEFLWWELNNAETKAYNKLIQTYNPKDSAFVFAKYYERPLNINNERMDYAQKFHDLI
jgi:hypothetical protein